MLFISLLTLIVAIPLYTYRITPYTYIRITTIVLIYSALLAFNSFYIDSIQSGISIYSGLFQVTTISQRIEIFIYIVGSCILFGIFFSDTEKNKRTPTYSEFSLMIIFTSIGASFLISSSDLISLYLSIELQSFAVYVLATLYRNSESSTAAGLKYFLLGGLSSAIILLGTGIIYSYTGITQIESISNLITTSLNITSDMDNINIIYTQNTSILFGIILITIGFLFKVAAAPFHSWAPDVYDGVPTIITSWITTMPKISIFILLLELHSSIESIPTFTDSISALSSLFSEEKRSNAINTINYEYNSLPFINSSTLGGQEEIFKNLLLICSLFSLIIGTIVGLSQYRIKRLLAFSTISHVGFILLALAIYTEESIDSFLFYIFQYSVTNVNVFLILLRFGYILHRNKQVGGQSTNNDIVFIDQLKGQFYSNPLLSIRFAISLFSMAGIPPLVGFFAKQMVLYSSIHNGYYFISIVAILVSVISASYYLKIIQIMYFRKSEAPTSYDGFAREKTKTSNLHNTISRSSDKSTINSNIGHSITNLHSTLISIITIFITLFMIYPSLMTNTCQILRLSIFSYLFFSFLTGYFITFLLYYKNGM
uniref:NADH-ubiquinone oxidoreductase chain 2 n=1 Tax=Tilletia walkeri TaxID=117179 RepID=B2KKX8_9BASI|nr:ND2 [Tilletia walkeri]ABP03934.1 ND2 [Tilletia walkeri]